MPVVRRIRNRGATVTVEAHAEVLFMPGGDVHNWTNRFTGRIRAKTIQAAPTNKRPRWAHYGKPLKGTIVSARPRFWGNGRNKMRVYGAVGSAASYAYYVDQGTGIHNGSGPYPAKILPPWEHGAPSLYEATWRPGGPGTRRVQPVMIKGQKGQQFFDKGLRNAFRSMRMRSAQVPGEGGPKITDALRSMPTGLEGAILGPGRQQSPAFIGQLNEWRKWRDEAWAEGKSLGRDRAKGPSQETRTRASAASAAKPRPKTKAKTPKAPKPPKPQGYATLRDKQDDAVRAFAAQNPNVKILNRISSGLVVVAPATGERVVIPWSRLYPLI